MRDNVESTPVKTPIQAIDRAVALLSAVAAAGPNGASLKSLAAQVGLQASTARTLLSSLSQHGIVDQNGSNRRYLLGARLAEFTRTYVARADLAAVAAPVLERLWQMTDETVHLAALQGPRRVDLTVLVSRQLLNVNPTAAKFDDAGPSPLYRTAAGKILLAGLDDDGVRTMLDAPVYAGSHHALPVDAVLTLVGSVREQGYATNVEEEAAGVCGVAAPVRDNTGSTVAALCIGYPVVRHTGDTPARLRRAVIHAADEISGLLGAERDVDHVRP